MAKALYLFALFCSAISQMPTILDSGMSMLLNATWILPLVYMVITSPRSFFNNKLLPFYLFVFGFTYFAFICQSLTGNTYFSGDVYNFYIALLVTIVSFAFWERHGDEKMLQLIPVTLMVATIPVALEICTEFLLGADLMSATYAYMEKNSAAHLMLNTAFISMTLFRPRHKVLKWGNIGCIAVLLIVMLMLRSRATIVSALYIIAYFVLASGNKKVKIYFFLAVLLVMGVLVVNSDLSEVLVKGILLGGRESNDMNDLSSNRIILMLIALPNIPKHPWIGVGDYYIDCMPFAMQLQYGVIGLTIVFSFLFCVFKSLRRQKGLSVMHTTAYLLFMALMVNSIFEARSPFGPGAKTNIMWVFYAIVLAHQFNKERKRDKTQ